MNIYRTRDYDEMSYRAAVILSAQVILKPDSVLGLATGSSPVGIYRQMGEWCKGGDIDFSRTVTINLDEYRGLSPDNPQSYRRFMQENLFRHINIRPENTHVPDGLEADAGKECARYDGIIESCGGIDLQVLGIGHNGHIGFNEPADMFVPDTHCVQLTERTIEANTRFFENEREVPREAYTMGVRPILQAGRILLIVSGEDKAAALREALRGPVTPRMPASILQLHRDVTLVADEAALSLL